VAQGGAAQFGLDCPDLQMPRPIIVPAALSVDIEGGGAQGGNGGNQSAIDTDHN
jgi:hypothetical protein